MRIGKNINTENKKKVYRKPVVEVVEVDRVITLQTSSGTIDAHGVSSNSTEQETTSDKPVYKNHNQSPNDNNPFGGGSPDFER